MHGCAWPRPDRPRGRTSTDFRMVDAVPGAVRLLGPERAVGRMQARRPGNPQSRERAACPLTAHTRTAYHSFSDVTGRSQRACPNRSPRSSSGRGSARGTPATCARAARASCLRLPLVVAHGRCRALRRYRSSPLGSLRPQPNSFAAGDVERGSRARLGRRRPLPASLRGGGIPGRRDALATGRPRAHRRRPRGLLLCGVRHPSLAPDLCGRARRARGRHAESRLRCPLPMVAVGLLYRQGYFRQRIDTSGWQHEYWVDVDPERLPVERSCRDSTSATGTGSRDRGRRW